MRNILIIAFVLLGFYAKAKKPDADEVLREGKFLFTLEQSSLVGTEHFLKTFPEQADSVNGYLSYQSGDFIYSIFYRTYGAGKMFARYRYAVENPGVIIGVPETKALIPSDLEKDLIQLRSQTEKKLLLNKDGYFTQYSNLGFDVIPIIGGKERKVYVLSAAMMDDYVFMGNDYLLTFNENNKYRGVERIHQSLVKLPVKKGINKNVDATMHHHLNHDIITATDICTLLLYRDKVEWNMHYVMGKKYVSIFHLDTEELVVVKSREWKKMQAL